MSYVLRHRIFRGQDVYIVVSMGTPTPIVAICNYLMLAFPTAYDPKLTPSEKRDGKIVSKEDLLNLWVQVSMFALSSLGSTDELVLNSFTKGELLFEDSGLKPSHVGSTRDFLSDDISPDLKTSTFILSLCKELNISLHHGWLVNLEPQSAALRGAFTSAAPNELQVHAMNAFKSGSVDQLTGYGRASLNIDISEGAFALLFRKNNLSVLCKYHGHLFELETDNDIWNVVKGAMWKTLCLSVSQEVFLASDFSCTDMQLNSEVASVVEFIKQWKRSEEEIKKADDDKLLAMFDSSEKKKSGKVRKKNKKTAGEGIPGRCGDVPENTASTSGTANDAQSAGYENASPAIIGPDTDNVQSAGNGSGAASAAGKDGNERVLSYGDVMLLRSDLTILRGPHFLNDRIIAFYLAYLSLAFEVKDDDDADLVLLPPSIPYLLSNLPDPDSVAITAEPIRLASRRLVLLPVNDNPDASLADGGSHWTLLVLDATAGASRPRFVHHDSLGIINDQAVHGLAAALRPLLPATDNGVPLVEGPTPKQINGHDCGVYILAVAKAICNWWRDSRGQQQEGGTDWFDTVRKEVNAESVKAMRTEMLHLISRLIQEKEEEKKKNKAMEVGKEH